MDLGKCQDNMGGMGNTDLSSLVIVVNLKHTVGSTVNITHNLQCHAVIDGR